MRNFIILVLAALVAGCASDRWSRAVFSSDVERERIRNSSQNFRGGGTTEGKITAIVRDAVDENENWSEGAVYEVRPSDSGWRVTAWKIDGHGEEGHTQSTHADYRVIEVNEQGEITAYHRGR